MGNICSKSANKDDNFSSPGRPLGSSSASNPTASTRTPVPAKVKATNTATTSPGRTLGSAGGDGSRSPDDARSAAARAAEERANAANKPGGKLKSQLDAQKKKTQNQVLNAGSEEERLKRAADENAQVRSWN